MTLSLPFKSRIMGFFSLSLAHSFYLARQPSKWKVFFLTSSLLLTLPLYLTSHLFLQPPSVTVCKDVYLYLVWQSWCGGRGLIRFDVPRRLSDESIRDKRHEETPVHSMSQLLLQLSDRRCLRRNISTVLRKRSFRRNENQSCHEVNQRLRDPSKMDHNGIRCNG